MTEVKMLESQRKQEGQGDGRKGTERRQRAEEKPNEEGKTCGMRKTKVAIETKDLKVACEES